MSQSALSSRKRKGMEHSATTDYVGMSLLISAIDRFVSEYDRHPVTVIPPTAPLAPTIPINHTDGTVHTKRQREHRTPVNYLDVLPKDVLSHLFFYLKLLGDEEMYSLGKTSRSMLSFIQTRYERSGQIKWYIYPVNDIKKRGLKVSWTTPEERSRYVLNYGTNPNTAAASLTSAATDQSMTEESSEKEEWVILRHNIRKAKLNGLESLPIQSFVLNEYQPNRFAIGQITRLCMSKPSAAFLNLPHLKFLPSPSLKQLELVDVLMNSTEVIQTYGWPQQLQNITLNGFDSYLLNSEMINRFPSALQKLRLGSGELGYDYFRLFDRFEIWLPPSIKQLYVAPLFGLDPPYQLPEGFPPGLLELTFSPRTYLRECNLPDSLQTIHLLSQWIRHDSLDGWILPSNLTTLTFGEFINVPLRGMVFNQTLTHLHLGGFNHSLRGVTLPASLRHLEFGPEFQQSLLGVTLPQGLTTLIYGNYIDPSILHPEFSFPPSLVHLRLGLYKSKVDAPAADDDDGDHDSVHAAEPSTLTAPVHIRHPPIQLPQNLRYLQIPVCLLSKNTRLPVTITELVITSLLKDNDPSDSLICVKFPASLELIKLDGAFNQPLDEVVLPVSLRKLHFGESFNQSLDRLRFPIGLEEISLTRDCFQLNRSLVHCKLPASLKRIQFYECRSEDESHDDERDERDDLNQIPLVESGYFYE